MAKKNIWITVLKIVLFLLIYAIGFVVVIRISMNSVGGDAVEINSYDDLAVAYNNNSYARIDIDEFERLGYITISVKDSNNKIYNGNKEVYTDVFVAEFDNRNIYLIDYFSASVEDNKDNKSSVVKVDKIKDINIVEAGNIDLDGNDYTIAYEPVWGQAVVICFLYSVGFPLIIGMIISVLEKSKVFKI